MANSNLYYSTTADIPNGVPNYAIPTKTTDGNFSSDENTWTNSNASKYYGYFYNIGEFRSAIKSYAIHILGWGYTCANIHDQHNLNLISGNGKETFWSIMFNHLHTKKFNGDAYAEIIRDDKGILINLKPLDPRRMTHITNKKGRITAYDYEQASGEKKRYAPEKIFHSMNNRILDEPHGTSETSAVEWVCEAIQEAERDWRRLMHYSSVRILYADETDTTRLNQLKTELATGIKNGSVVILTCKPEEAKFEDLTVPPADAFVRYLNYLENKFYSQLGISKVAIGGTTENNTEASAKVNMVITEPVWIKEITELQDDILNQLGIELKINKQPSLMENMQADEAANTGQTKLEYQGAQ
jgi:hypothetical protein